MVQRKLSLNSKFFKMRDLIFFIPSIENGGVETNHLDINYRDSSPVKYLGKVEYNQDEEDFVINDYADEKPTYKPRQLDLPFGDVA